MSEHLDRLSAAALMAVAVRRAVHEAGETSAIEERGVMTARLAVLEEFRRSAESQMQALWEQAKRDRASADAGRNDLWAKVKLLEARLDAAEKDVLSAPSFTQLSERLGSLEGRLDSRIVALDSGVALREQAKAEGPLPSMPAGRTQALVDVYKQPVQNTRDLIVRQLRTAACESARFTVDQRAVLRSMADGIEHGDPVL